MTKIIGISGRKQSGKSTTANYINGDILLQREMVKNFYIDAGGELIIETSLQNGTTGYGVFDLNRKDAQFVDYAEKELWPFVKLYHFADALKSIATDLFDIAPMMVYGTDDDKNSLTHYQWENMPTDTGNTGRMTAREFLQYFGTTLVRTINNDAWVNATINKIQNEGSAIAVVPDVRFPNEVKAIKQAGGVVVRMERDPFNDSHPCESALDKDKFDWDEFDIIVPNTVATIADLCDELSKHTSIWR